MMNRTFIILFFIAGFNILLSQQNCYNLDLANKTWYKKDSVVSVENISKKFEVIINEKIIHNFKFDGEILFFRIYDILGKNIPFMQKSNLTRLDISINEELIKNKMMLITFTVIKNNAIHYITTKIIIE